MIKTPWTNLVRSPAAPSGSTQGVSRLSKNRLPIAGAVALAVALTVPVAGAAAAPLTPSASGSAVRMAASADYLYGIIYGPDDKPIGGITLQLLAGDGTLVGSDVSDSSGQFHIDAPQPGLYNVRLVANSSKLATSELPIWVEGATRDSEQIMAAAVQPITKPSILHLPKVGNMLRGDAGTWPSKTMIASTQWLRDGKPIAGTYDDGLYLVRPADIGHALRFEVTGQKGENGAPSTVTSNPVTVVKGTVGLTVRAPSTAYVGRPFSVAGRVTTPVRPVSGTVSLRAGKHVVGTAEITRKGRFTLTATAPAGRHVYRVRYSGDAAFNAATSHRITLSVRHGG